MTNAENLDWLYRLKSEIYVYMPKEWLIPMDSALDEAIKALSAETVSKEVYDSEYYRRKDAEFKLHELTHKEPCEDVISRQSVLEWIQQSLSEYGNTYTTDMLNMWGLFEDWIKNALPVEAVPLSVIEDIKYDVEKYFVDNIWAKKDDCSEETKHFKAVLEIIDKAVKEYEHE